jgi:hypothetical protein
VGQVSSPEVVSRTRIAPGRAAQDRGRQLAERFPEAREALEFCAAILAFDGDWNQARMLAPASLRDAADLITGPTLEETITRYLSGEDCESPASFFARILLRRKPPRPDASSPNRCPECGQPPQCGCLHPEGHGSTFFLVCSLCAAQWRYPRSRCPACGEEAAFYSSDRIPHIQTQACERCRRYLHVIDLSRDPAAIPLLDEVAALALDVWARENGYRKIHPNLVGI